MALKNRGNFSPIMFGRLASGRLLEEVTDLMLILWRAKTNISFDSLLIKWELWCFEQGSDTISGLITSTNYNHNIV